MNQEMVIEPLKKERVVRDLIQLERMDVENREDDDGGEE